MIIKSSNLWNLQFKKARCPERSSKNNLHKLSAEEKEEVRVAEGQELFNRKIFAFLLSQTFGTPLRSTPFADTASMGLRK